jgi:hypothetical protein
MFGSPSALTGVTNSRLPLADQVSIEFVHT